MRNILKYLVNHTYRPLLQWYLSKDRTYSYKGIKLDVNVDVFHPGFFYSSKMLLDFLDDQIDLEHKRFLELGCGTGLISIFAAKEGSSVIATDISTKALENASMNAINNEVEIKLIQSDLFEELAQMHFDLIAINPPYYRGDVKKEGDYAWYCGESLEYFDNLFKQLPAFMTEGTEVYMVLSDECELDEIKAMAKKYSLHFECRSKKKRGWEWNFIFQLVKDPIGAKS